MRDLLSCILHSFVFHVPTIMEKASMDSASAWYSVSIVAMLTWMVFNLWFAAGKQAGHD